MSDRKQPTAGKGDKPRTVDNKNWRNRYDDINWGRSETKIEGFRGKPKIKFNVNMKKCKWKKDDVTFPVPPNDFGIFAHHTDDGIPLDDKSLKAIIEGPVAAMESAYQAELKKPVSVLETESCTNDDLRDAGVI